MKHIKTYENKFKDFFKKRLEIPFKSKISEIPEPLKNSVDKFSIEIAHFLKNHSPEKVEFTRDIEFFKYVSTYPDSSSDELENLTFMNRIWINAIKTITFANIGKTFNTYLHSSNLAVTYIEYIFKKFSIQTVPIQTGYNGYILDKIDIPEMTSLLNEEDYKEFLDLQEIEKYNL